MQDKQPVSGSKTLQNTYYLLAIIALFTVICWFGKTVITTIAVSFMIALALEPAVLLLERIRLPRWFSVLAVISITLVIVLTLSTIIFQRSQGFISSLPKYRHKIEKISEDIQNRIHRLQKATENIIPQPTPEEKKQIREVKIQDDSNLTHAITAVMEFLSHAILVPFIVFFILIARDDMRNNIANLFGNENRNSAMEAIDQIQAQMIGFLSGNMVSVIILWIATSLGFMLVGVDYAILSAGIFAFCNIVPVIGVVIGLLPPVVLIFLETESFFRIAWIAGFGMLMHLIYANVLTPKLVGSKVKLNPVAILVAMVYWSWLWGITGLVLAIPLVAAIKTVCDHVEPWKPVGKLLE
jgi:predicted PurR-regulated permease PerM